MLELETRLLRYFLTIAHEHSLTRASEVLHVTKPNLSKQMKNLEAQCGQKLLLRSNHSIRLTEAGKKLLVYAQSIVRLSDQAIASLQEPDLCMAGDVTVGCGESISIRYLAQAVRAVRAKYPGIRCHIISGDTQDLALDLQRGNLDFAVIFEAVDPLRYDFFTVPAVDSYGVLMRKDDPLAAKSSITPLDLGEKPLICSRQAYCVDLPRWFGKAYDQLNMIATFNLNYNGTLMVREGIGYSITFLGLSDISETSELCMRPMDPPLTCQSNVIWKLHSQLSPQAALLLAEYRAICENLTLQHQCAAP